MVTEQVTWSDEYYNLYGLAPVVTPSYENWLASILPADRPHIEQKVREAIEQGKNLKVSFRIAHPDEGQRWIMVRGQTFYDTAGTPTRMTGIAITLPSKSALSRRWSRAKRSPAPRLKSWRF
jgi:PAS domain-containing protein